MIKHVISIALMSLSLLSPAITHAQPVSQEQLEFFVAVGEGDAERVQELIEQGVDVNYKPQPRTTPLVLACLAFPNPDIAEILLKAGADPNQVPFLPFAILIERDDPAILDLLFTYGAEIEPDYGEGDIRLLTWASRPDREGSFHVLLKHGADPNFAEDGKPSLLISAAGDKTPERFIALLNASADIHHRGFNDRTALHQAAGNRATTAQLKLLIERVKDVNVTDEYGISPIMFAATPEAAQLLLDAGADITRVTHNGSTTLILAAGNGATTEVLAKLIELGASTKAKNNDGETALLLMTRYPRDTLEPARLLLENGADPNVWSTRRTHPNLNTPFMHAVKQNNPQLMSLLLKHGADPELSPSGRRAAHILLISTGIKFTDETLRILCESIDLEHKDHSGETILHATVRSARDPRVVEALVLAGADPNAINNRGQRPVDLIKFDSKLRHTDAYELLRSLTEPDE